MLIFVSQLFLLQISANLTSDRSRLQLMEIGCTN